MNNKVRCYIKVKNLVGRKDLSVQIYSRKCKFDFFLVCGLDSKHYLVNLILFFPSGKCLSLGLWTLSAPLQRLSRAQIVCDGTFPTFSVLWNTLWGKLFLWWRVCLWAFLFLKIQPMEAQGTYRDSKLTSKIYRISNMYWPLNASHVLIRISIIISCSKIENKFKIAN